MQIKSLLLMILIVGCSKSAEYKIPAPVLKPSVPDAITKEIYKGYKCDISNGSIAKEIFIQKESGTEKNAVRFFDISKTNVINLGPSEFDKHSLLEIKMTKTDEQLTGETIFYHTNWSDIIPEGKFVSGHIILTLDDRMDGKLERKLKVNVSEVQDPIFITTIVELARISNCQKAEATIF